MTDSIADVREIVLDGSVNFRDLGGLTTADGRVVRGGRVFRSDALHALSDVDLDRLAGHHISTLIDLRSDEEIERSGASPLVALGTRVVHTPIMERTAEPQEIDPTLPMEHLYAHMLDAGRDRFGEVFRTLADPDTLPAVIHCAAGKDRTGVTIALLLRLLGVPDEAIVLDYAITDRNMARLMDRLRVPIDSGLAPQIPPHFLRAEPATMQAFLVALDERYESAEAYLTAAGVPAGALAIIRSSILGTDSAVSA